MVLPAPSALESVDDGILDPAGRQASNLDLELLDGAPLIEASGVANWSVGSLNLEPAGELDLAWAIFRASGLDSDGSAIPLSIQLETDKPGWLAISDYSRNRWRIISFSGSGGIPLANGDELVSTAGHCHVAVLAWQDGLDLTSLVLTSNQQPAEPLLNEGEMLGVNMERIGDSARAWSFVDVFKCSRAFTSTTAGGAPDARPLDLDEHGWVKSLQSGQAATAIFLNSQMGNYPAGQFICLYEGSGSILAVGDVSIASQTPGRIVLDYAPTAGGRAALRVTSTDPKDYIRGIHVVFPEYEVDYDSQIFHPDFLSKFSPFKVVRFLNWTRSNNSPLVEWEERGHLDHQTQDSNYGVAPEYICALCNRLQADAWVNIPHLASDDYVASYAQFLRDNLDPGLRVFVEHSNELWGGFAQGDYAEAQGLAAQLSDDPYTARIRWHSQRSVRIFEIFEESFAGSARLVRVMGAAHHDPFTLTEALDWQDAWQHVDVVATAPYIGGRLGAPANAENTKLLDIAGVIQAMDDDSVLSAGKTLANRAICDAHGVGYVAYEGGQALYGQGGYENDPVLAALFIATNRDPGMRQLYFDHHKRWHDNGGGLFMAFTYIGLYSGSGCWGIFETQQQDTQSSFKYLGLLDYDATLP
ncbi:MAG: hypothetical protein H7A35_05035 [Planctomycetales bacterium]|nr:hypothetical protein [bacterium]UNM09422.1 MAG: hypothetical protein H7A35_05035 [Planctomycetales bacterium]